MNNDKPLTRSDLVAGLDRLGLQRGQIVMVHSSLSSLGHVDGGPDTVIDALIEVLGVEGTLLMPTHPARDGRTFDPATIPSAMGLISETFRRRPEVLRSRNPYHPVAALGKHAGAMLKDHELSPGPDGPDTPYGRLISRGGRVAHIGCDIDTMTLLHAVEAELDLPYLRQVEMQYFDDRGDVQTLRSVRCPGGPRDGVFKFDRLFQAEGGMRVAKIGRAVCRLISAPKAAEIMRRELSRDPCYAIGKNPHCRESRRFRGKVKADRLTQENFTLVAPLWDSSNITHVLSLIQGEGISQLELDYDKLPGPADSQRDLERLLSDGGFQICVLRLTPGLAWRAEQIAHDVARWRSRHLLIEAPNRAAVDAGKWMQQVHQLCELLRTSGTTVLVINRRGSLIEDTQKHVEFITHGGARNLRAAYRPADVARSGKCPFTDVLYRGKLRTILDYLELADVVSHDGTPVAPGRGNAAIRQAISNLRCRSFDGVFTLRPLECSDLGWLRAAEGFWHIMDEI